MFAPVPIQRSAVLIATVVSLAACNSGTKNLTVGSACTSSDECATNLTCDSGQCLAACNLPIDCPLGNACSGGLCVPLPSGFCGQSLDCTNPPDTCHVATGATCRSGTCTYPRKTDPICAACTIDADCDPLTHGLDRCSTGVCGSNNTCVFTAMSNCPYTDLATSCAHDNDCKSGHCASGICCDSACNGVCQQCNANTGRCEKPDDDNACGVVACSGLNSTTACRSYKDLSSGTQHRCAALGRCAQAGSASDCVVYSDFPNTTVCRKSGLDPSCDPAETCVDGSCPDNVIVAPGEHCLGTTGSDIGVCDDVSKCEQLPNVALVNRYFLEESALTADRIDAVRGFNLTASYTGDVFAETDTTGQGLHWGSNFASSSYCRASSSSVTPTTTTQATLEVDFTPDLSASHTIEWIAGFKMTSTDAPYHAPIGLVLSYDTATPTQATLEAFLNGASTSSSNVFITTIDPTPARIVVHLVYDSTQATAADRIRVYVNGAAAAVARGAGNLPEVNLEIDASDANFCIGNNAPRYDFASFTGVIWYAAIYKGVLTDAQILTAAKRLMISDAP